MARPDPALWLRDEFAAQLGEALALLAGAPPLVETGEAAGRVPGTPWRCPLAGSAGTLWIAADPPAAELVIDAVLDAAGIAGADPGTRESTLREALGQACGGLARSIGARCGRDVAAGTLAPHPNPPPLAWHALRLTLAGGTAQLYFASDPELAAALALPEAAPDPGSPPGEPLLPETPRRHGPPGEVDPRFARSKTLELLLDVEMPVRVSFGRTMLPLKDILKLTTGSIVELNRSVADPVEVIVNNCVVARGEVVVVEGNFGIRIDQVVSKEERLRVLY